MHTIALDPPVTGGVVVGFDGSVPGRRALEWAWQDAAAHGRTLHVVQAWTLPTAMPDVGAPPGVVPSLAECAAAVTARATAVLEEVRAATPGPAPEVHLHVVHGPADDVLTAAARRADLLVVGHRGHNLLTLVLGSVATHVLEHAGCPVVVLPLS